jgi:hypothetical protein
MNTLAVILFVVSLYVVPIVILTVWEKIIELINDFACFLIENIGNRGQK